MTKRVFKVGRFRRYMPIISSALMVLVLIIAAKAVRWYDAYNKTQQPYLAVDRYLQAYFSNNPDAFLEAMPESVIDASLAQKHRDKAAWLEYFRERVHLRQQSYQEQQITSTWSLVSVEPWDTVDSGVTARQYRALIGKEPDDFRLVRVYREERHGEDQTIVFAGEEEYIAVLMDEKWYVGSTTPPWIQKWMTGDNYQFNIEPLQCFIQRCFDYDQNPSGYADKEFWEYIVPQALEHELKENNITQQEYEHMVKQRFQTCRLHNEANGISYGKRQEYSMVYLRCEDELPALKQTYLEKFGITITDACYGTVTLPVTTPSAKSERADTVTCVKVDGEWYVDIFSLPWAEFDMFSFGDIHE